MINILYRKLKELSIQTKLTLFAGLTLSLLVFYLSLEQQKQIWSDEFRNQVQQADTVLKGKLEVNEQTLNGIASFFKASEFVSRQEFKEYTTFILKRNDFIQALEWIPRVPHSKRGFFEKKAQKDGHPQFQITDRLRQGQMARAKIRNEYFPVYYIEPFKGNEKALGFDLASDSTRLKSLYDSRDSSEAVATSKIMLVQEKQSQAGILIFYPFYGKEGIPSGREARRENLKGFVLGVYRLGDMMQKIIIPNLPQGINLVIYEENIANPENKLFGELVPNPPLEIQKTINFHGRIWILIWQGSHQFQKGVKTTYAYGAAFGVLLITILISVVLKILVSRNQKIEDEVRIRTKELHQAKDEITTIVGSVVDPLITIDEQGLIEVFNPAAERTFGYSSSEVIGRNIKMLMPGPYHSKHDNSFNNYLYTGETRIIGRGPVEVEGQRKDGSVFPLDLAINLMEFGDQRRFVGIGRDITERKLAEEALREAHDNLETRVEQRTTELKLSNEELKKEIIERQRAEKTLKNTYKQLLHSEKLNQAGKLSADFAHEFNNPLTVVIRGLDHISDTLHLDENSQKLFHTVNKECVRMADLVQKLLDFHRPSPGNKAHVDIHTLIDEMLLLQESTLSQKSIKVEKHYAPQLPKVHVVADQIKQILLNLIKNAHEAITGEEGMITIGTESTGDQIKIKIQDTGEGISPQNLEFVFDPFFTTKKGQQGTGLGLSVSFGIVKAHGGDLSVESKPGAGSTFTLALPGKG